MNNFNKICFWGIGIFSVSKSGLVQRMTMFLLSDYHFNLTANPSLELLGAIKDYHYAIWRNLRLAASCFVKIGTTLKSLVKPQLWNLNGISTVKKQMTINVLLVLLSFFCQICAMNYCFYDSYY